MVPETLIHIVEGKANFSIVEILNKGRRTWVERGVGGKAEDLMPATGYWHETNQETWVHRQGYVEDGRLVNWTNVSKMYNGERRLSLFLYHSFSTHAQGNLLRRFICSRPDLGYKQQTRAGVSNGIPVVCMVCGEPLKTANPDPRPSKSMKPKIDQDKIFICYSSTIICQYIASNILTNLFKLKLSQNMMLDIMKILLNLYSYESENKSIFL